MQLFKILNVLFTILDGEKAIFQVLDGQKVTDKWPWLERTTKFTRRIEVKYKKNNNSTLTAVPFPYDPEVIAQFAHS